MDFATFILAHEADDLAGLALSRARHAGEVPDFDLALTTLEVRRKLRAKVPEWYACPGLQYPFRLSGEQCSSSETARYKSSVAAECLGRRPARVADLTGGLGVDSWAFAQVFDSVLYNEMRPELAEAARHNFSLLGLRNVRVSCHELMPGGVADVLDGFHPELIFLDPARRASDGRKVFRLEDCQPDVTALLPELFAAAPLLLLKLSPMADITQVCRQLHGVKQVHAVAAEGECKELLLLLERDYEGAYDLYLYENGAAVRVDRAQGASRRGPEGDVALRPGGLLFEPGKALLKAGAFEWPCGFGLEKPDRHTHLYFGSSVPERLRPFGKTYRILEVMPLNNRNIKYLGKLYPQASVTARNIPLSSEQLRAKLGVRDGGSVHIFGLGAMESKLLVVCEWAG